MGLRPHRWRVSIKRPQARDAGVFYLRARRKIEGRSEEFRQSAKTRDEAVARERAAELEQRLNRLPASGRVETVSDVLTVHRNHVTTDPTKSQRSAEGIEDARKKLDPLIGSVAVRDFSKADFYAARDAMMEDLSPATVKKYLACLAAAWRWALEEDYIDKPWPRVKKIKAPATQNKRPYTDDEVRRLLEWASGYQGGAWAPLLELLADTGRRVSEVLALRGRDLDRDACTIRVAQKRGARVRELTVPVPPATMARLPAAAAADFIFCSYGRGGGGRRDPSKPRSRYSVLGVIRKGLKAIEVPDPKRLDTHSLRRAFVASAERAGVATDLGRRVTGHETRAMWDRYQAAAVGDDLHRVVAQVKRRRSAPPAESPKETSAASATRPSTRPTRPQNETETRGAKLLGLLSLRGESNPQPPHYE